MLCARSLLPPSENRFPILGLNLLRLLAQNSIADFHSQLVQSRSKHSLCVTGFDIRYSQETMSPEALESAPVQFPVSLEQNMMEGSYTKDPTPTNWFWAHVWPF